MKIDNLIITIDKEGEVVPYLEDISLTYVLHIYGPEWMASDNGFDMYELSPEKELEIFVKIQHKLLDKEYPLEYHLKTVKKLPRKSRLEHYEVLFKERWISEKQYNTFIQE